MAKISLLILCYSILFYMLTVESAACQLLFYHVKVSEVKLLDLVSHVKQLDIAFIYLWTNSLSRQHISSLFCAEHFVLESL